MTPAPEALAEHAARDRCYFPHASYLVGPSKQSTYVKNHLASLVAALTIVATPLLAQDGLDIDVNIGQESAVWYANPWIWVGVAAFILLLVLAMRRPAKAA